MEHIFVNNIECKECTKCHKVFSLSNYNKDSHKKDGLSSWCKNCIREKDKRIYYKDPHKKCLKVKQYQIKTGDINKYRPYNPDYYKSEKSKEKKKIRDKKRHNLERIANETNIISEDIIKFLHDINNGKCEYCGIDCSDNFHIDHKLPLFRGGTNDLSNLAFCCPSCNWSKGKKTVEEWKENISC